MTDEARVICTVMKMFENVHLIVSCAVYQTAEQFTYESQY